MSKKLDSAIAVFEMIMGAIEKNAPRNEEIQKMLEQTRKFLATVRKNEKLVQKWLSKEYPQWKTLTVYFRERDNRSNEDESEDFVL